VLLDEVRVNPDIREAQTGKRATYESLLASSLAVMMSMILTEPDSRARALKSSSSPAFTVRDESWRWTISRPSWISASSVVAQ
jgi:hypothetical protein